eukprot:8962995-Alexandrium_andersonii.AAC.1
MCIRDRLVDSAEGQAEDWHCHHHVAPHCCSHRCGGGFRGPQGCEHQGLLGIQGHLQALWLEELRRCLGQ